MHQLSWGRFHLRDSWISRFACVMCYPMKPFARGSDQNVVLLLYSTSMHIAIDGKWWKSLLSLASSFVTCHVCVLLSDFRNSSNTGTPPRGATGTAAFQKPTMWVCTSQSFDVHIANGLAASRMNWFICYVANSQVGWMQSSTDHRSKVMLPAQDYLFHPPSSLPYLTVNWHILFAKLLWFQGRHAVDELLAIPRDASWSCPLRKLRHLSGEIVRRVQVHDVLIYTVIRQKKSRSYHHLPLRLRGRWWKMQMAPHLELFLVAIGPVSKVNTIVFIMCYTGIGRNCCCKTQGKGLAWFSLGHDLHCLSLSLRTHDAMGCVSLHD